MTKHQRTIIFKLKTIINDTGKSKIKEITVVSGTSGTFGYFILAEIRSYKRKYVPMSIIIAQYVFDGPYGDTNTLKDVPGIFAIQCYKDDKYYPIDVGESDAVKWRVENHDRKYYWNYHCHGRLKVAVYYTPGLSQEQRLRIVKQIRKQYKHPCDDS